MYQWHIDVYDFSPETPAKEGERNKENKMEKSQPLPAKNFRIALSKFQETCMIGVRWISQPVDIPAYCYF